MKDTTDVKRAGENEVNKCVSDTEYCRTGSI